MRPWDGKETRWRKPAKNPTGHGARDALTSRSRSTPEIYPEDSYVHNSIRYVQIIHACNYPPMADAASIRDHRSASVRFGPGGARLPPDATTPTIAYVGSGVPPSRVCVCVCRYRCTVCMHIAWCRAQVWQQEQRRDGAWRAGQAQCPNTG